MTNRVIKDMTLEEIRNRTLELDELNMHESNEMRAMENELRKRMQSLNLTDGELRASIKEIFGGD